MSFLRFGDGSRKYVFPGATLHTSAGNFADVATRSERLPGLDGGFDVYGSGPAPVDVGRVTLAFTLVATTRSAMTAKRDAVNAMQRRGLRRLWKQPTDPAAPPRWCWARVKSIRMNEDHGGQTDLHQPVQVIFEAPDPRWYSKEGLVYFDTGAVFDGSWTFGGVNLGSISAGDEITLTNGGSAPVPLRLDFRVSTALTALRLQHYDPDDALRADVSWAGTLAPDESLTIDSAAARVLHRSLGGAVSGYPDYTRNAGVLFFMLEPGANRLVVTGTFTGLTATAEFYDGWR